MVTDALRWHTAPFIRYQLEGSQRRPICLLQLLRCVMRACGKLTLSKKQTHRNDPALYSTNWIGTMRATIKSGNLTLDGEAHKQTLQNE